MCKCSNYTHLYYGGKCIPSFFFFYFFLFSMNRLNHSNFTKPHETFLFLYVSLVHAQYSTQFCGNSQISRLTIAEWNHYRWWCWWDAPVWIYVSMWQILFVFLMSTPAHCVIGFNMYELDAKPIPSNDEILSCQNQLFFKCVCVCVSNLTS